MKKVTTGAQLDTKIAAETQKPSKIRKMVARRREDKYGEAKKKKEKSEDKKND